jgi:thiol-disulfide isomerase/thioredoxin
MVLCGDCLATSAAAADTPAGAVLHLVDGSFVAGELRASADPKVLNWRAPAFAEPLTFPLGAVHAIQYPVAGAPPKPTGDFFFELMDGDVLYGDLLGVNDSTLELKSARIGQIHLRRDAIVRFYRWNGADTLYLGPNGLSDWQVISSARGWRDEGGRLATETSGASVFTYQKIPDRAMIEAELSWKRKPNFMFVLGDPRDRTGRPQSFRLEVWDDDLVMVGESAKAADAVLLQKIGPGEGRIRFQACLNREEGRLTVLHSDGTLWATVDAKSGDGMPRSGLNLTNITGDIRLEYVRIVSWNGQLPGSALRNQPRLRRLDGSIVYGDLISYDPKTKQFVVREGKTEVQIKLDALAEVYCASAFSKKKAAPDATGQREAPPMRVVSRDGSCLSGWVTRIEDKQLSLVCPGIKEELRLPLADLRRVSALHSGKRPPVPQKDGQQGRLEMDGLSLRGRLVAGSDQQRASCLRWHSDLALNASSLVHGASGRIVFREPQPTAPAETPVRTPAQRQDGWFESVFGSAPPAEATQPPASVRNCSLHLCSGDAIPCEITGIDERGVSFKTPQSNTTFVTHDKIKSVVLMAPADSPKVDTVKRDRLLTLPRLQKDVPPPHLICSPNGDFLRGRVVELNEKKLKVEVRLELRQIPRDRVAQIIWLQADELKEPLSRKSSAAPGESIRLQAVRTDGNRLTFASTQGDGKSLFGKSDVLGACQADLKDLEQLLIGDVIEQTAAKLAYGVWKLHHALEPKFAQVGPGAPAEAQASGLESPLIGQPAPAIKLDTLEGRPFNLADHKGRVVVIDFWATWCGPCMQVLPLLHAALREFPERDVTFIAVNLEEQPDQIRSMLERHKLKIPVALDRDGVAAARYDVTAIPRTVIVDRDGKVARVFVGGGKDTPDALRKAVAELAAVGAAPAAKTEK